MQSIADRRNQKRKYNMNQFNEEGLLVDESVPSWIACQCRQLQSEDKWAGTEPFLKPLSQHPNYRIKAWKLEKKSIWKFRFILMRKLRVEIYMEGRVERESRGELGLWKNSAAHLVPASANACRRSKRQSRKPREYIFNNIFTH